MEMYGTTSPRAFDSQSCNPAATPNCHKMFSAASYNSQKLWLKRACENRTGLPIFLPTQIHHSSRLGRLNKQSTINVILVVRWPNTKIKSHHRVLLEFSDACCGRLTSWTTGFIKLQGLKLKGQKGYRKVDPVKKYLYLFIKLLFPWLNINGRVESAVWIPWNWPYHKATSPKSI